MNFSVALIARNEAASLPRLVKSLSEFQKRGGEIVLIDTGSTDNTPKIARDLGCKVFEEGERFLFSLPSDLADRINQQFVVDNEEIVVRAGDKLFDYAAARNYAARMASNDIVAMPDCDEAYTVLNLDAIENTINGGAEQLEYHFVFSHDSNGAPAIQFRHCKFYDRRKLHWKGIVHEVLEGEAKRVYLNEDVIKLEHWQGVQSHRSRYIAGLALDCYLNQSNDRNSHYMGRELLWTGRPKSAIKELTRHIDMNKWQAEKAQSMVFVGDAYANLGDEDKALEYYHKAFLSDGSRREPLMRLAQHFYKKNDPQKTACYCAAALEIPWNDFYANHMANYTYEPHELLYWALWYMGNKEESKKHFDLAFSYNPTNPKYINDRQFYYANELEYKDQGIEGWMTIGELNWLYNQAKKVNSILELGSWQGRSSHALLSGCKGTVTCVDTFQGSEDTMDGTNAIAKTVDVYSKFMKNVGHFKNLEVLKMTSAEAAELCKNRKFDMVFIDADHRYEQVKQDIKMWKDKATIILSGHDWIATWAGVQQAVRECVGEPSVCESIWYTEIHDSIRTLQSKIENNVPFAFVKHGDGEDACMNGASGSNCDGHPYSKELAEKLRAAFDFFSIQKNVQTVLFDNQSVYNTLLHRTNSDLLALKSFYGTIRDSARHKVFVGPERLKNVATMLRAEFISIPLTNAFGKYDKIMSQLRTHLQDNGIYMFSAGMPAKPMIAELLQSNPTITCLDIGSSFDPLFVGDTRTHQASQETLKQLYSDFLQELPKISILIPTLGREGGLKRCLDSIDNLLYPEHLIEVLIDDRKKPTVPIKVNKLFSKAKGDIIVFASNDMEFTPNSLYLAVKESKKYGLVSFNTGELYPDMGNRNEHFLIRRDTIEKIGGKIFSEKFHHVGCDNLLWEQCAKIGEAIRCNKAIVKHYHFSRGGQMDKVYEKGWSKKEEDRNTLKKELEALHASSVLD